VTARKKKWLLGIAAVAGLCIAALFIAAHRMAKEVEPYIRDQAVQYLEKRFDSDVEIGSLHISVPKLSPLQLLGKDWHGAKARVEGERVILRHKGRTDIPPLFRIKQFAFEIDLSILFDTAKRIPLVTVDGMEVNIPPKGERPGVATEQQREQKEDEAAEDTGSHLRRSSHQEFKIDHPTKGPAKGRSPVCSS
jgi:hypothetical protein